MGRKRVHAIEASRADLALSGAGAQRRWSEARLVNDNLSVLNCPLLGKLSDIGKIIIPHKLTITYVRTTGTEVSLRTPRNLESPCLWSSRGKRIFFG